MLPRLAHFKGWGEKCPFGTKLERGGLSRNRKVHHAKKKISWSRKE